VNPDVAARAHGAEPIAPPIPGTDGADARVLQRLRADIIGHGSVPSAPTVLFEILRVLEDDEGDLHRLFATIERDPGLTGRILRTANGAFFGQSRNVTTVQHAVTVLGVAMVRGLAVSAAVFQTVGHELPATEVDAVWRHSLATGVAARLLAGKTRLADRDDAFTAGLLHDAGRLVLWRRFPEFYRSCEATSDVAAAERATLGVDHATAGGWLFDAWKLPGALTDAVAGHHAAEPGAGLSSVVALANLVVHDPEASALAAAPEDPRGAVARSVAAACGLSAEGWADLAAAANGDVRS